MSKLGANNQSSPHKENNSKGDNRSRTNSLRNGETTKTLQNLNIDVPIIEKETMDEFVQFKQQ